MARTGFRSTYRVVSRHDQPPAARIPDTSPLPGAAVGGTGTSRGATARSAKRDRDQAPPSSERDGQREAAAAEHPPAGIRIVHLPELVDTPAAGDSARDQAASGGPGQPCLGNASPMPQLMALERRAVTRAVTRRSSPSLPAVPGGRLFVGHELRQSLEEPDRPPKTRRWRAAALTLLAVAVVILAIAGVIARGTASSHPPPDASTAQAIDWLMHNTDHRQRIATDTNTKQALEDQGYPAELIQALNAEPKASLVLVTRQLRADSSVKQRSVLQRYPALASFGAASHRTDVRQVTSATDASAEAKGRAAGDRLLTNVRLQLTPRAWATVSRGDADPRLLRALGYLIRGHDIDVADMQSTSAEMQAGAPARTALITAVDGVPIRRGSPVLTNIDQALRSLPPPFRPQPVALQSWHGAPALSITFLAPTPWALAANAG